MRICQMLGPNKQVGEQRRRRRARRRESSADDPVDGARRAAVEAVQQRAVVLLAVVVGRREAVAAGWRPGARRAQSRVGGSAGHVPSGGLAGFGAARLVRCAPSRASSSAAWEICASRSSIEAAMSRSPPATPSGRGRAPVRVPWRRRCRGSWSSSVSSPCRRYPVLMRADGHDLALLSAREAQYGPAVS